AFLIAQGIETLPLRMRQHVSNAESVADYLSHNDKIAAVHYAGLQGARQADLVDKYLPKGAGAVFCFDLEGGRDAGVKLIENLHLFSHLANVGDAKSLVIHPATTTHRQLGDDELAASGIGPGTIRVSIGIEDTEDLIADLDHAIGLL
ncbi:MAG: PLP-dependent transferase, partial [Pseudomonadales bacterium]|nr:PLP-dependent transferase [Pseudomonadales bacterium]